MATSKPLNRQKATLGTDDAVEVKLVIETTIGIARTASEAMTRIGAHWDNSPYGDPVRGHYEFEIDDHLFTVTVSPVGNRLTETPFGSVHDANDVRVDP